MWLQTAIAAPDFGRFSTPCQSRLAMRFRIGRITVAPNLNQPVTPRGLPDGGA